ncbi:hypothetical protein PAXRUDRAFT_830707 [Paxillus rubicundulus Ve08.2h10]|uniref:Uncharacterized protein n=1 Tax=Paxillus rubicundulus Ve08.2h10 TaxID=930991 RepID=A0A0D0E3F9_9AGAM|nr:hypothetical protein PAXRUDRAFT_830707 [Paxillus rubicundulus Ve08.2h10]
MDEETKKKQVHYMYIIEVHFHIRHVHIKKGSAITDSFQAEVDEVNILPSRQKKNPPRKEHELKKNQNEAVRAKGKERKKLCNQTIYKENC